jgi:uncharacterized membrane protein
MRLWLIPMFYAVASAACGFALPRLERAYLPPYAFDLSVASAQTFLSAVASGTMALTGIVFAIAFVAVQFSAVAYSPRLVLWFARDPMLFHSLGVFVATFMYSLSTLLWVDRAGAGTVPFFSSSLVAALLIVSVVLFARLIQRIVDLQITNVLNTIGNRGRQVIRDMFSHPIGSTEIGRSQPSPDRMQLGPVTQVLRYSGEPRTVASFNIAYLIKLARQADAVFVLSCAVGDTLVENTPILQVHNAKPEIPRYRLLRALRLSIDRTFEQDPKYPIRLLVDIAIKALSPAINDPTTAVQAIDQIEDLLHRLGRLALETGYATDSAGILRVIFPMPTWDDYLALAFDEIRQYGATSVQVMRRLRSALTGIAESLTDPERSQAVRQYLAHLDLAIQRSELDAEDQAIARQEDRQGLGLTRKIQA